MLTALLALALALMLQPEAASMGPKTPTNLFVGAQLAVTAEPDDAGELGVAINVAPLVVELSLTSRVGLRATSLCNYQFVGPQTGIAQLGGGLTLPIYLPGKGRDVPFHGFYVGPHVGASGNRLYGGADLSWAAEGGVRWHAGRRWTVNLAGQLGASWLVRPDPAHTRWVMHFGFYPSVGIWVF